MNENSSEVEIVIEPDDVSEPDEDFVEEELSEDESSEGEESGPNGGLFLSPDDSESDEVEFAPEVDSAQVVELEEQVAALETERDDFKNRMIRVAADLENFRKRTARERDDMRKYGIDRVVLELLPVLDNLERAITHGETTDDPSGLMDGVHMVQRQLISALKKHGVEGFDSLGEAFDPTRHEAIQQVETSEKPTGTVMEQYQKGYFLHDRLVRAAMVAVAKFVEPKAGEEEAAEPELELIEVSPDGEAAEEVVERDDSDGAEAASEAVVEGTEAEAASSSESPEGDADASEQSADDPKE